MFLFVQAFQSGSVAPKDGRRGPLHPDPGAGAGPDDLLLRPPRAHRRAPPDRPSSWTGSASRTTTRPTPPWWWRRRTARPRSPWSSCSTRATTRPPTPPPTRWRCWRSGRTRWGWASTETPADLAALGADLRRRPPLHRRLRRRAIACCDQVGACNGRLPGGASRSTCSSWDQALAAAAVRPAMQRRDSLEGPSATRRCPRITARAMRMRGSRRTALEPLGAPRSPRARPTGPPAAGAAVPLAPRPRRSVRTPATGGAPWTPPASTDRQALRRPPLPPPGPGPGRGRPRRRRPGRRRPGRARPRPGRHPGRRRRDRREGPVPLRPVLPVRHHRPQGGRGGPLHPDPGAGAGPDHLLLRPARAHRRRRARPPSSWTGSASRPTTRPTPPWWWRRRRARPRSRWSSCSTRSTTRRPTPPPTRWRCWRSGRTSWAWASPRRRPTWRRSAPSFGAAHLFIDDCPDLTVCYSRGLRPVTGSVPGGPIGTCWNLGQLDAASRAMGTPRLH